MLLMANPLYYDTMAMFHSICNKLPKGIPIYPNEIDVYLREKKKAGGYYHYLNVSDVQLSCHHMQNLRSTYRVLAHIATSPFATANPRARPG